MAANWRVNVVLGFIAFLFSFLLSILNNTLVTSLVRSSLGFLLFFLIAYMFRVVMYQIAAKKNAINNEKQIVNEETTPDGPNQMEKYPKDESIFQSLPLQSLHDNKDI